jgi:hypothetical protein
MPYTLKVWNLLVATFLMFFVEDCFLQFHSCLQPGCRDESFEEEGQTTTVFKKHPNTFHSGGGTLTF